MDMAATFLDFAGATKPAGMTSQSLRPLLMHGGAAEDRGSGGYRPFVSSGLQSYAFNESLATAAAAARVYLPSCCMQRIELLRCWRVTRVIRANPCLLCCCKTKPCVA